MKKLSLIFFGLLPCFAIAQHTVRGTVTDQKTKEEMTGASVLLKGTTTGTTVDVNGNFELQVPNPPPFTLIVSFIGYAKREIEVKSLSEKIKIEIASDEVMLKDMEVVGQRISDKQKQAPLTVESMDIIAIKQTSASNFYEGLGQLKGVDLTSASLGFKVINTRGFNSTSPVRSLQIIDGVDNQSPGLNFSLGNFLGASELDVLKVDLVVGASSAFYGPNAFNGVISMTSKNPFQSPGLAIMIKVGERNLSENAIRYAQVFKNKKGEDKFAYKLNIFYMRAYDWEATNDDPSSSSTDGKDNPGGYDAVNRYGDENITAGQNNATSLGQQVNYPGLKRWYRTGYWEKDLVDYDSRNLKLGAAFHYKIKPDIELIYASNLGNGTTVYQGDNRYSLKDILFLQNRVEINKKDKFFLRAYSTHEDAGKSYDAVFTAFLLQNGAKQNNAWSTDYRNYWNSHFKSKVEQLPGYKPWVWGYDYEYAHNDSVYQIYHDSLIAWHDETRGYADNNNIGANGHPFFLPGTSGFDSAFAAITSKKYSEGGTRFYDKSALYHVHGEYKFTPAVSDIIVGGNYRLYAPNSAGTIFSDTGSTRITNYEYGAYAGIEKKIVDKKLKLNLTARTDKNQNFNYVLSPAASAVYTKDDHIVRLSFSSALRNPTLADQYLYYNVGRAILLGNIQGIDSLVTVESLTAYLNSPNLSLDSLVYFNIAPVRPEKVKTIEIGYRATLFKNIFLDAGYYYSIYHDFIGYRVGVRTHFVANQLASAQGYRVASNAGSIVTTQGFSVGANYYFGKYYSLAGNYSFNILNKQTDDDPLIPAYNTPRHKFNIGLSGRDIAADISVLKKLPVIKIRNWGFNVNYKWVEGFIFEGSPQFTGSVPAYDLLDAQINYHISKIYTTIKIGASNVLNKKHFEVYGGPRIGRLACISLFFEPK